VSNVNRTQRFASMIGGLALVVGLNGSLTDAQGQAPAGSPPPAAPAPDPTKPALLEIAEGTTARYKVREQFVGINFPSDAVGTTEGVTGSIVLNPDGSIDAERSKITVDLRTLQSDQRMRDGYIQGRTLQTEEHPHLVFVPKRAEGLEAPLPDRGQAGFQLIGDMTLRGVTKEVTWNVVATFGNDQVAGRATTSLTFEQFEMTKPSIGRLMSVDDKIDLEIEFRSTRSAL
jgi:polyisoprenoid-binding protein YceI